MSFSLRIYAFLENKGKYLVLKEPYGGDTVHKLPGGGLEEGEGSIACLKREFLEELNLHIQIKELIYATDYYESYKGQQVIKLYYTVRVADGQSLELPLTTQEESIEAILWLEIDEMLGTLDLEADKRAWKKLKESS